MKTKLSWKPGNRNGGRSSVPAARQSGLTQVFSQALRTHANLN